MAIIYCHYFQVSPVRKNFFSFFFSFFFFFVAAIVWRYDYHRSEWKGEKTLAYVGDLLELEEGKEGAQRNAYMVEFVDQEDPLAG